MGRHRSTIAREIARNRSRHDGGYRYAQAQERTNGRRSRSRRNSRFGPAAWDLVVRLLREGLSPDQISGRLRLEGQLQISHESIYRFIRRDKKRGGQLFRLLRQPPKEAPEETGHGTGRSPGHVAVSVAEAFVQVAVRAEEAVTAGDATVARFSLRGCRRH